MGVTKNISAEPSKAIWHFAYGANICPAVLVGRRRIKPYSAQAAFAPGYEVVFNMPGIYPIEPVFANLVAKTGAVAHGVLYKLSTVELKKLRSLEGAAYQDAVLRVQTHTGLVVDAHVFMSPKNFPSRRPSRRYLALLIEGATEHKLPLEYIEKLKQTPSVHVPIISDLVPMLALGEHLLRVWKMPRIKYLRCKYGKIPPRTR